MSSGVANDPGLVGRLVKIFSRTPTGDLIANLDATIDSVTVNGITMPLSRSDAPTCYLCSPSAAYIDYAIEETRHFTAKPWLQKTLLTLIRACRPLIRATGLDRQVQPNNWLFSTNPVPALSDENTRTLRDDVTRSDPDRAIVIRSLNSRADTRTMAALRSAGFLLLPSRQIYIFDPQTTQKPSEDAKRDQKLLANTPYELAPAATFSAEDYTRAADLYSQLYLEKYTDLNPQYSAAFLAQAHQIGLLQIIGLRGADDLLDGVIGLFENGQTLTMPLLGYDTRKPQKLGLYRILNAIGHQHALNHGKFYNMSAGAADFKRNRGATPDIEYTAVYVAHLGLRARIATRITKTLLDLIGVPLLRKFGL
ncbi:GNAT family N-acetyltransferase [Loktanella agnita]|uniref:GNAT family N-acetyltransferase n=1 Tax=Loktanella agnita TaxID=287097 RepID=UPI00398A2354